MFLSAYVPVTHAFLGTVLKIFPYLKTLLRSGMYLIKLASACPLSNSSLSLSIFPNTSFKFDVLSIAFFSLHFFQKNNANRVSSNEFLLTLKQFYKINLLYRSLLFPFSMKIIHHVFPTYNLLFFSLWAWFYTINYIV